MAKSLPKAYELRGAKQDETDKVLDYLAEFMDAPREYFARIYRNFPQNVPENSRIVLRRGQIVAHVHAFPIDFWMNGVRVPAMMIGDVSTHPDHRRKGLGRLLLEDACRHGRKRHGATFAFLKSGVTHFYQAAGWDVLPMRSFSVDVSAFDVAAEAARSDPTWAKVMKRYVVRRFERAEETDKVAHVHEDFNRGRSLAVIRSADHWHRHFCWTSHHEIESLFLVAQLGGDIVAYSRANDRQLTEQCYLSGHEPAALALFESTIRQLGRRRAERFEVLIPEDHCLWRLLGGAPNTESRECRLHWLRQIDWSAMFECFRDAFNERLERAGLGAERPVTLSLGGQSVRLPSAERVEPEKPDLELSQLDSFRLVTGTVRCSTLTEDAQLGRLLDCLFEPCSPIFWPMDVV